MATERCGHPPAVAKASVEMAAGGEPGNPEDLIALERSARDDDLAVGVDGDPASVVEPLAVAVLIRKGDRAKAVAREGAVERSAGRQAENADPLVITPPAADDD